MVDQRVVVRTVAIGFGKCALEVVCVVEGFAAGRLSDFVQRHHLFRIIAEFCGFSGDAAIWVAHRTTAGDGSLQESLGDEPFGIDGVDRHAGSRQQIGGAFHLLRKVTGGPIRILKIRLGLDRERKGSGKPKEIFATGNSGEVASQLIEGREGIANAKGDIERVRLGAKLFHLKTICVPMIGFLRPGPGPERHLHSSFVLRCLPGSSTEVILRGSIEGLNGLEQCVVVGGEVFYLSKCVPRVKIATGLYRQSFEVCNQHLVGAHLILGGRVQCVDQQNVDDFHCWG